MSGNRNSFGLNRHIPSAVKLQLRQESGYGCVYCGNAIVTYEHIDPEFSVATKHDPNCMACLCGGCHTKVNKGLLSKESVNKAKKAPRARQTGFSFDAFDIGNSWIEIQLGNSKLINCENIISVNCRSIFAIRKPEVLNGPFRLNAVFYDSSNSLMFSIEDNEYKIKNENWDVEIVGPQITIRNAPESIALQLKADPPNRIIVEKLDMLVDGGRFHFDINKSEILSKDGSQFGGFTPGKYTGCETVFDVHNDGIRIGVGSSSSIQFGGF
jgi:hypothetical protein